jgi:hypothetical protein
MPSKSSKNRKHFELIALLSLGGAILSIEGCQSCCQSPPGTVLGARMELPALSHRVAQLSAGARTITPAMVTQPSKVR